MGDQLGKFTFCFKVGSGVSKLTYVLPKKKNIFIIFKREDSLHLKHKIIITNHATIDIKINIMFASRKMLKYFFDIFYSSSCLEFSLRLQHNNLVLLMLNNTIFCGNSTRRWNSEIYSRLRGIEHISYFIKNE